MNRSPLENKPLPPEDRVGYALVGLGKLTLNELVPAFRLSNCSKLTALVSDDREKALEIARGLGLEEKDVYDYADYDRLAERPDVNAVYIVLPNALHREYTERAARIGKHVLCEKPLATSPEDAETMVRACAEANRLLMTAYRMQYTPQLWAARDLIEKGDLGRLKFIEAVDGQTEDDPGAWRLKRDLAGGGALPDIGLYCLNTARFLTGEEPYEVFAYQYSTPGDERFKEVEEAVYWTMRFPSGAVAHCTCSYDVAEAKYLRAHGQKGWLSLDPAFSYEGLRLEVVTEEGREVRQMREEDQFRLEIDHFSECILGGKRPFTPGEEGVQDQRLMAAIYQSAAEGKPVRVERLEGKDLFRGAPPRRG
ncbi:MAG: gfo/Idh/MocA family oxidoreductase [Meiothermus sp.]